MKLTKAQAQKKYPQANFDYCEFCWIGQGARIEQDAVIRQDAWIERGAWIGVVIHKYICCIQPFKQSTKIKMGCECHTISKWKKEGAKIATEYNESQWWQDHGKSILALLINEARVYDKKYRS